MELSESDILKQKIADLQAQMLASHPQMPSLLRTIHSTLLKDQSLVQVLSEDEIAVIVNGLKHQTRVHIIANAKKPTAASLKKKHATLRVDEL